MRVSSRSRGSANANRGRGICPCSNLPYSIGRNSESTSKPLRNTTPLTSSTVTVSTADALGALSTSPLYVAFRPQACSATEPPSGYTFRLRSLPRAGKWKLTRREGPHNRQILRARQANPAKHFMLAASATFALFKQMRPLACARMSSGARHPIISSSGPLQSARCKIKLTRGSGRLAKALARMIRSSQLRSFPLRRSFGRLPTGRRTFLRGQGHCGISCRLARLATQMPRCRVACRTRADSLNHAGQSQASAVGCRRRLQG